MADAADFLVSAAIFSGGTLMPDHTYRIIELAGSSEISHADAIENAIARASKTIRQMRWFEVVQMRGEIENGEIRHYQVTLKVGFHLEDLTA